MNHTAERQEGTPDPRRAHPDTHRAALSCRRCGDPGTVVAGRGRLRAGQPASAPPSVINAAPVHTTGADPQLVFGGSYAVDTATNAGRIIVLTATLLVIGLSIEPLRGHRRESQFYVLLLLGALGTTMLVGAADLLLLAAGYLLASIPVYALTGFVKDALGTEAALKYYLLGALLGVLMLTGVTILYGASATTSYQQAELGYQEE